MRYALLALALCGCATPTVDVQVQCLPLKEYTPAQQQQLTAALAMMSMKPGPSTAILSEIIIDYERMRDADRACMAALKK